MSCKCQECGRQYKIDLMIEDLLWEQIRPINKSREGGLLCAACICEKLELLLDDYYIFNLDRIK